jgi:hypothetical protein
VTRKPPAPGKTTGTFVRMGAKACSTSVPLGLEEVRDQGAHVDELLRRVIARHLGREADVQVARDAVVQRIREVRERVFEAAGHGLSLPD